MADALDLIPVDRATACLWPVSATDARLHLRIIAGDVSPEQRAWLHARGGRVTILDPSGSGSCRKFWQLHATAEGWADAEELRRELGKIDCECGRYFRLITEQIGRAA